MTQGRCVNNRATLHSLIWDLAKLGVILQIELQIHNLGKNIKTLIPCHIGLFISLKATGIAYDKDPPLACKSSPGPLLMVVELVESVVKVVI